MIIAFAAIVPSILVIIPMVIPVIVAFAGRNDAARHQTHHRQNEAACGEAPGDLHDMSFAIEVDR
jgi:hypothetical protein